MDDRKKYFKKYCQEHSEHRNEYNKKYYKENKEGIKTHRRIHYKENKEEISIYMKKYNQSIMGKINHKKHDAKRRQLGFVLLNKPFDNCVAHHISENFIIHIPKEIHKSIYHNIWIWKNMNAINKLAIEYL